MKTFLVAALMVLALASPAEAARLQIIILNSTQLGHGRVYNLAFWYDVPPERQKIFYTKPKKASAWSGATAQDNKFIENGSVFEELVTYSANGGQTIDQVEARAQALWQVKNAAFQAPNHQWANYGSTFDGNTWTTVTVP